MGINENIRRAVFFLLQVFGFLFLSVSAVTAQEVQQNGEYQYCYNEEYAGLEILSYEGIESRVRVPEEIDGVPVRVIGSHIFPRRDWLVITDLILPESVLLIKQGAFALSGLERAVLPKNLQKIEGYAFEGCSKLREINLPKTLRELPESLFSGCSFQKVVIPSNVKYIGPSAFSNCAALKQVVFETSSSLREIGGMAFMDCVSLREIKLPDSLEVIGYSAFSSSKQLTKVIFGKDSRLKEIGSNVFYECISLKKITIPKKVKKIEKYAFYKCKNLKKITFLGSAPKLGKGVFQNINGRASFYIQKKYKTKYKKVLTAKSGYRAKKMRIRFL